MSQNTIVKNDENKLKTKIIKIIDGLINELRNIINLTNFDSRKEQIEAISKLKNELEILINSALKKSIFNFTKMLLSKDLRRNVSYYHIIIKVQNILDYSVESSEIILDLWREKEMLDSNLYEQYIDSLSLSLISILEELKTLMDSESRTQAKKMIEDSQALSKAFIKILDDVSLDYPNFQKLSDSDKIKILYKLFVIVRNFELIIKDIDVIADKIIYIKTGIINNI